MPPCVRLFFPDRHPLPEIFDDLLMRAGFHPAHVFPGHHVILHHLISLVIDAMSFQPVKAVLRSDIDCFLTFQTMI